jgi:competence protein ComEA
MSAEKVNKLWLLATGLLILIIIVSSLIIWSHKSKGQLLVVYPPKTATLEGQVYVYGAVALPKVYTLKEGETIANLVNASGGTIKNADLSHMHLYVPSTNEDQTPQKINLNRAETWLLEALPNIGETRAQAILEYRQKNGHFKSTQELTSVPGISPSIFDKIKDLITVAD